MYYYLNLKMSLTFFSFIAAVIDGNAQPLSYNDHPLVNDAQPLVYDE